MPNSVEAVWKTVKEIKLDDIRKGAMLPLKVALLGTEDELIWLQEHFAGSATNPGDLRRLGNTLRLFEPPPGPEQLKQVNECHFACVTPGAASILHQEKLSVTAPIYTIGNEGEWEHFKREILDTRWDLHMALGRNLPGLRSDVIEYLVVNMACVNAEIAVASAVTAKIPGIPIYPGVFLGETILLTKNQIMMAFRLAGACGLPVDIVHRKFEVLSIIGQGFGWRAVAKEAVGMVPALGIALKGAIAYAGTYAVGKAIAHLFDTGHRMERAEERKLYKQAVEAGKAHVSRIMGRFARKPARFRRRGNRK